jgi:hypothetical protein
MTAPDPPSEHVQPAVPMMGGSAIDSVMPIVLFLGLRRFAGLSWAIVGATLWALKVAFMRKRRGYPVGKFLPIITLAIIGRGIVSIITDSEAVYFGIGIAFKAGFGIVLILSAVIGRNLIGRYAPLVFGFDRATTDHRIYKRAMNHIAWVAGVAELISAAFDVWLFRNSSVGGYLTIRFFVNWPFTSLVLFGSIAYLSRELAKIPGFLGMGELIENQMKAYEDALKLRRSPRTTDS